MNAEDIKPNPVSNMVFFHEFVLQCHNAAVSGTQGSEVDEEALLPRYEIEEGENWLRLLQKEGRSILDDTQSSQELADESQSSTVYPSIVALSNVGMVEAPSLDCFICIDLDGTTVAVKDMRTPVSENQSIEVGISRRSSAVGIPNQLGIFRKKTGRWENLQRRRLRILSPGDRICTSIIENSKPGGLCLEYQFGERPLDSKNNSLSQGLLTQPQDEEYDGPLRGDERTLTQQSLPSQKLEVLDEDDDDDSDRTVCIEESNPLDDIRATSQASVALLGTQPDSDEDTDEEESKRKKVNNREISSQRNEALLSDADAALVTSKREATDGNSAIVSKGVCDSDDDTDVGEVCHITNAIEGGTSCERPRPALKVGKGLVDEEEYNKDARKKTSALLSDPIEDSDDETDLEGEKNVCLATRLTTKLQHRRGENGKLQVSEGQIEDPSAASDGSNMENSSSTLKKRSYTGFRAVQFSPSLCGETEDPPESNLKFIGQDSVSLSSPIVKESAQETVSENSVSLLSPTKDLAEPTGVQETTNGTKQSQAKANAQKIPGIEKGQELFEVEEDERTENSRTTPLSFPPEKSTSEFIEEHKFDTEGEEYGIRTLKYSPLPSVLAGQPSPPLDSGNEQAVWRKSKRRRSSETSKVESALGKKLKLPTCDTSKSDVLNGEASVETFCDQNPPPTGTNETAMVERGAQTQISPSRRSEGEEIRKPRSSGISNSTSSNTNRVTHESTHSDRKRRRASRETVACLDDKTPIRVLTTGIELTPSQKGMIKRFGGVMLQNIEDAHSATHVIAGSKTSSLRRTPKLMIGLCKTSNIVDLEWLIESSKQRKALPSINFQLLHDVKAEAQYKFEMRESLRRAARMRLKGTSLLPFLVFCCPGVAGKKKKGNMTPPVKEFRCIVEAAGGKWSPSLTKVADFSKLIIVVSKVAGEAEKQLSTKKVSEALKNGAIPKSTEEIFNSIMQQQFIP